jgi:hypothetical protein
VTGIVVSVAVIAAVKVVAFASNEFEGKAEK